jgi:hypothetical protein
MTLNRYFIVTLVDITNTGVVRAIGDQHKRDQQRNWETVLQTIGILTQPIDIKCGPVLTCDVKSLNFGEMYQGIHKIWVADFSVEHQNVFSENDDELSRLKDCFNQVPIITGLDETARFLLPIFYCEGAIKNISFWSTYVPDKSLKITL